MSLNLNYFKMKSELENILNEVMNDKNIMGKPLAQSLLCGISRGTLIVKTANSRTVGQAAV